VVSIDRPLITEHFRRFKKIFKGLLPFEQKKTFLRGLTTPQEALLNQGAYGV
jgi:hypothetical protein